MIDGVEMAMLVVFAVVALGIGWFIGWFIYLLVDEIKRVRRED